MKDTPKKKEGDTLHDAVCEMEAELKETERLLDEVKPLATRS